MISLSVVSHAQAKLIHHLLNDLKQYCADTQLELILTLNLAEALPFGIGNYPFPIKVLENPSPKGFAANHNAAFQHAQGEFFCVINPDIRLCNNPFPALLTLLATPKIGVVAPLIVNAAGELEDSARRFPTPLRILSKALGRTEKPAYLIADKNVFPDWVGGMFMLFPSQVYRAIQGFDAGFFLYYEDVDLCARLHLAGYRIALTPSASAIHEAQRSSHRSMKYLRWHIGSMMRFFCSWVFVKTQLRRLKKRAI